MGQLACTGHGLVIHAACTDPHVIEHEEGTKDDDNDDDDDDSGDGENLGGEFFSPRFRGRWVFSLVKVVEVKKSTSPIAMWIALKTQRTGI